MLLNMKKSAVWIAHSYIHTALSFPLSFIRRLVFVISKRIYKRPEWIPLRVIHFCFPVYPIQDNISRNGLLIPFIIGRLSAVMFKRAEDFKLLRLWDTLVIRNRIIPDSDYEDLFKILDSDPDMLFSNIMDYSIKCGDIDIQHHHHRVLHESRYRDHIAEIRDAVRVAIG